MSIRSRYDKWLWRESGRRSRHWYATHIFSGGVAHDPINLSQQYIDEQIVMRRRDLVLGLAECTVEAEADVDLIGYVYLV